MSLMYAKKCAGKEMHHCTILISCKDPLGNEMMHFKGLILIKTSQRSDKSKKTNKTKHIAMVASVFFSD